MDADTAALGALADINIVDSWALFGAAAGATIGWSGPCMLNASGLPIPMFNAVMTAAPVDDPDQVVAEAIEFMERAGVPWLLWVREGVDDALLDAGRRAGLGDAGGPSGMVLPSIPEPPPPPAGLVVEVADDEAALAVYREVVARGFGMPGDVAEVLFPDAALDADDMALLIGWVDSSPVSASCVTITGAMAGVYNVATPEEHRRRGYGGALTWAAIDHGRRRGCAHACLQASELGAPIYRSMGFVDIGTYVQLAGPA